VRLNADRAAGKRLGLNLVFTDLGKSFGLSVQNAVLNHGPALPAPDATVTLAKATLDEIQLGRTSFPAEVAAGRVKVDGRPTAFAELFGLLDTPAFWFNIVTP
jgi:alkyl sulfatase BDS1-like metallo-beta-lactamase superfamily hydrolase